MTLSQSLVNLSSSVVIAFGLLLVTIVVVGTFDHKYDYTRRMFKESFEELPVALSDIKNLKGNLVSLQVQWVTRTCMDSDRQVEN